MSYAPRENQAVQQSLNSQKESVDFLKKEQ